MCIREQNVQAQGTTQGHHHKVTFYWYISQGPDRIISQALDRFKDRLRCQIPPCLDVHIRDTSQRFHLPTKRSGVVAK